MCGAITYESFAIKPLVALILRVFDEVGNRTMRTLKQIKHCFD